MSSVGDEPVSEHQERPSPFWLLLLALALMELLALGVRISRVASVADWRHAAELVRAQHQACDAIAVSPAWADPWLRWALGDRIALADAGRSDLSGNCRLWALTLRGTDVSDAPNTPPDFDQLAGRIRVRRWPLAGPTRGYDFGKHVREARVSRVVPGGEQACEWKRVPPARGGGLGVGAAFPTERFSCDSRRPWLFVAPVVLEDLELKPRYCIWQHPQGSDPVIARFENVPLEDTLVFEGGLYYEHERDLEHGPVHATIAFDGSHAGRMIHADGDGWKRVAIDTRAQRGDLVTVSIAVSADQPHLRSFCWNASTRRTDTADGAP